MLFLFFFVFEWCRLPNVCSCCVLVFVVCDLLLIVVFIVDCWCMSVAFLFVVACCCSRCVLLSMCVVVVCCAMVLSVC